MIINNPHINKKLGYYVCDNLEFDSKIRACMYAVEKVKPVTWIFNNAEFNQNSKLKLAGNINIKLI